METLKSLITRQSSQKQVAKDIGISPQTLSNYINDKTEPDITTLKLLAKYFHTTVDYLIGFNVPHLIDKSTLSQEHQALIDKIVILTREQCGKVEAYIDGLLTAETNKEQTLNKLKGN